MPGAKWWDTRREQPDNNGEFGVCEDWAKFGPQVESWLKSSPKVKEVVESIVDGQNSAQIKTHIDYVQNDLSSQIAEVVQASNGKEMNLAEMLAEKGILPMFGMPNRMRHLYHGLRSEKALTIDRDLEIAITEFAPGSQKTKDKVIHTSIGFTDELRKKWPGRPMGNSIAQSLLI